MYVPVFVAFQYFLARFKRLSKHYHIQVADYPELNYTQAVNDVKFHPHDHIVAFCSRGDNHKILLFKYEANIKDSDVRKILHSRPKMVQPVEQQPKYVKSGMIRSNILNTHLL